MTGPTKAPAPLTLIVEDKQSLRTMLRHALEAHDYAVVEAEDQEDATAALHRHRPAVVLTDLRLPKGDGFGVLRAAQELNAETSVIVMTAYGSIEDAVAAMKDGAMDFLAKPVDPDHLLLLVARSIVTVWRRRTWCSRKSWPPGGGCRRSLAAMPH